MPAKTAATALLALGAWAMDQDGPGGDTSRAIGFVATGFGAIGLMHVLGTLARKQIGTTSPTAKFVYALALVTGGVGGAAMARGCLPAVIGVGHATLQLGISAVVLSAWAQRSGGEFSERQQAVAIMLAVVCAAASCIALVAYMESQSPGADPLALPADSHFMMRQLAALPQAALVEVIREMISKIGPSVDRKGLPLKDRVIAVTKGLPWYAAAAILIIGQGSTRLLPASDGVNGAINFKALLPAVLLSCLANLVRGGANSAAVLAAWARSRREGVPANPHEFVPNPKSFGQKLVSLVDKTAIRFVLMLAYNVIYAFMRQHGYSLAVATMTAQAVYSCFAQYRDLFSDLMGGERWTPEAPEPQDLEEVRVDGAPAPEDFNQLAARLAGAIETEGVSQEILDQLRRMVADKAVTVFSLHPAAEAGVHER